MLKASISIGFIQNGTGEVRFVSSSGVTLRSYSNLFSIKGQYCNALLEKRVSEEVYYLFGMLKQSTVAP